jgi:hypothetical protein
MRGDMNLPSLLHHIFNPSSRKVGFGYQVFIWSTLAFLFIRIDGKPALDANNWIICVGIAGALIGGGTIADGRTSLEMAKLDAKEKPTV